jgi:hypothetical protein
MGGDTGELVWEDGITKVKTPRGVYPLYFYSVWEVVED